MVAGRKLVNIGVRDFGVLRRCLWDGAATSQPLKISLTLAGEAQEEVL